MKSLMREWMDCKREGIAWAGDGGTVGISTGSPDVPPLGAGDTLPLCTPSLAGAEMLPMGADAHPSMGIPPPKASATPMFTFSEGVMR